MNPRKRAYIELLIVAVIWGSAAPIIKYTLGAFSPALFLTYRFFISGVIALIFFAFKGIKLPKDKKTLFFLLFNGFLLTTVDLGLLFLGTDKTTSLDSNIISSMAPVTIAIAGVLFLKERVTKRESIGLLIALTGTFVTVVEPVLGGFKNGFSGLEGNLLVFAHILVTTAGAVIAKKVLRNGVEASTATNLSFLIGFITILPITLFSYRPLEIWNLIIGASPAYHAGVIYMAVLSGTLAYWLWHRAEKTIEIGEVGAFAYLYPVFGLPLSIFWLKEKIGLYYLIGCVIIIIGVLLVEIKKSRKSV